MFVCVAHTNSILNLYPCLASSANRFCPSMSVSGLLETKSFARQLHASRLIAYSSCGLPVLPFLPSVSTGIENERQPQEAGSGTLVACQGCRPVHPLRIYLGRTYSSTDWRISRQGWPRQVPRNEAINRSTSTQQAITKSLPRVVSHQLTGVKFPAHCPSLATVLTSPPTIPTASP
jgi:hypothetical protein